MGRGEGGLAPVGGDGRGLCHGFALLVIDEEVDRGGYVVAQDDGAHRVSEGGAQLLERVHGGERVGAARSRCARRQQAEGQAGGEQVGPIHSHPAHRIGGRGEDADIDPDIRVPGVGDLQVLGNPLSRWPRAAEQHLLLFIVVPNLVVLFVAHIGNLLQQRLDFAVFPAVLHGDGARVGRNGVAPAVAAPVAAAAARGRALSAAFEPVDEIVFQLEFVEGDLVGVLADGVEAGAGVIKLQPAVLQEKFEQLLRLGFGHLQRNFFLRDLVFLRLQIIEPGPAREEPEHRSEGDPFDGEIGRVLVPGSIRGD